MRARVAALGWPHVVAVGGALALAAAVPFWFSPFWVTVGIDVCVFAILGASYNLLLGRIGLFSLGHALLFGVAAYVVANLTARSGVSLLPAAVVGVVASTALAAVTGLVAAGARGIYFAMMTLAFAQVGFVLAETDAAGFSGGEDGLAMSGIPELININVRQDALYWLALAALVLVLAAVAMIRTSAAGRIWNAVRENDVRAAALGIDVRRQRVIAYSVAGAMAGVAGVIFALSVQTVTPSTVSVSVTVQALLITVIGGTGTFWGPVVGALFVRTSAPLLDELAETGFVQDMSAPLERAVTSHALILGTLYILFVLFFPAGVVGAASGARRGQAARNHPETPP
jgi:branched-chain amino acid transport system permease protein